MNEENVFTRIMGCLIANRISVNYNAHTEMEFRALGKTYLANKLREAVKAEEKVLKALKIVDKGIEDSIDDMASSYSDFITHILELNEKNQKRVEGLILKLRREEKQNGE